MNSQSKSINKNYLKYLKVYKAPILIMDYKRSEITKISINMFLISSLSMTNYLSKICELSGSNWHNISKALKMDKRIGKYAYLEPGLGLSGGNLERDLRTLSTYSKIFGINDNLLKAFNNISKNNKTWVEKILIKIINNKKKKLSISLLGLSYKENTNSIKNAPSIELIKKFKILNLIIMINLSLKIDIKT